MTVKSISSPVLVNVRGILDHSPTSKFVTVFITSIPIVGDAITPSTLFFPLSLSSPLYPPFDCNTQSELSRSTHRESNTRALSDKACNHAVISRE